MELAGAGGGAVGRDAGGGAGGRRAGQEHDHCDPPRHPHDRGRHLVPALARAPAAAPGAAGGRPRRPPRLRSLPGGGTRGHSRGHGRQRHGGPPVDRGSLPLLGDRRALVLSGLPARPARDRGGAQRRAPNRPSSRLLRLEHGDAGDQRLDGPRGGAACVLVRQGGAGDRRRPALPRRRLLRRGGVQGGGAGGPGDGSGPRPERLWPAARPGAVGPLRAPARWGRLRVLARRLAMAAGVRRPLACRAAGDRGPERTDSRGARCRAP